MVVHIILYGFSVLMKHSAEVTVEVSHPEKKLVQNTDFMFNTLEEELDDIRQGSFSMNIITLMGFSL